MRMHGAGAPAKDRHASRRRLDVWAQRVAHGSAQCAHAAHACARPGPPAQPPRQQAALAAARWTCPAGHCRRAGRKFRLFLDRPRGAGLAQPAVSALGRERRAVERVGPDQCPGPGRGSAVPGREDAFRHHHRDDRRSQPWESADGLHPARSGGERAGLWRDEQDQRRQLPGRAGVRGIHRGACARHTDQLLHCAALPDLQDGDRRLWRRQHQRRSED